MIRRLFFPVLLVVFTIGLFYQAEDVVSPDIVVEDSIDIESPTAVESFEPIASAPEVDYREDEHLEIIQDSEVNEGSQENISESTNDPSFFIVNETDAPEGGAVVDQNTEPETSAVDRSTETLRPYQQLNDRTEEYTLIHQQRVQRLNSYLQHVNQE